MVTTHFAEALDISPAELNLSLKPVFDANKSTWAGWRGYITHWNDLQASNMKLRLSSKICSAGNAMSDAGGELFRAGRKVEAEAFCEEGRRFWAMSVKELEWEERELRLRGGDSVSEMELDF